MNYQGFKPTIKTCEAKSGERKPFKLFREDMETYHFILGNKDADVDAIEQARKLDPVLTKYYLSLRKPTAGYGSDPNIPYREVDFCDSHHIMMSVMIAHHRINWGKIIEIGAGYGNMIRINEIILNFDEWIDIDLPFVSELAEWYLDNTLQRVETRDKVKFVSAYNIPEISSDLVIGAHSVSELAMDDFMAYYERVIRNTNYFFYATHLNNCGAEMLAEKLRIIGGDFTLVNQIVSEGGGVQNNLYSRNLR